MNTDYPKVGQKVKILKINTFENFECEKYIGRYGEVWATWQDPKHTYCSEGEILISGCDWYVTDWEIIN